MTIFPLQAPLPECEVRVDPRGRPLGHERQARGVHGSRGALPGGGLEMQQQQQQLRRTQSLNLQDVLPWFGPKLSKSAVIYWLFKQNLDQIRQMNDESNKAL